MRFPTVGLCTKKEMTETESYESYPPIFRPKKVQITGGVDSDEWNDGEMEDLLPVIDLQRIDEEKEKEKLKEACSEWGMFRLINHGIPISLLEKVHENAKKLFSLSFESKQKAFATPITYFWGTPGLTPSGIPIVQTSNWLEGFHVLLTPLLSQLHPQEQDPTLQSFRL